MKQKLSPEELEKFIHRAVRSLPDRKAPGTLESRVLSAIEHRAAIPWYHKSYAYWPAPFRAIFLAVATAVSGAIALASVAVFSGIDSGQVAAETASRFDGVLKLLDVVVWTTEFAGRLIGSIPAPWLYGGLGLIATLYVSLFGIGAVAYRTLFRNQ